jgi:hypothetical protein
MPFETLEIVTKKNMPPVAKLSYMRPEARGKSAGRSRPDAKPQLIIAIPTTICGTAKAKTFALALGSGADRGKLRVRGLTGKDAMGGVEPKELKHTFVFRFGFVPKLGDDIFDGEHRPVRKISDDEFEIEVPESWFNGQ